MAKLKTYTTKDDIPEALKEYYIESSGTWLPDFDGLKTQEDVDRVKAALGKEKDLRIEAQKDAAKFKDVDLDKWEKVKDLDPDNPPSGDPKDEKEITRRISEAVREKERELQESARKREEELENKAKDIQGKFKRTYFEQWRRNMLAEKFGFTNLDNLDTFILKVEHSELSEFSEINRIMKSVEVSEEDGRLKVVGGEYKDEKGALEVLDKISKMEAAKNYRSAPNNQGGGAGNGGSGGGAKDNPYKKESWNLTEQGRLESESPDDAKRLAAAAGVQL